MPVMPQKRAGWRIEPPVSVPVAAGARRAATAAAEPPDEIAATSTPACRRCAGEYDAGHARRRGPAPPGVALDKRKSSTCRPARPAPGQGARSESVRADDRRMRDRLAAWITPRRAVQ